MATLRSPRLLAGLLLLAGSVLALPSPAAPGQGNDRPGQGPSPVDVFHPDLQPDEEGRRPAPPAPALGGTLTLQLASRPTRLASALDGSSAASRVQLLVHETLLRLDAESWRSAPALARRRVVEDQLVLSEQAPAELVARARELERAHPSSDEERERVRVLYGELSRLEAGWRLQPRSPAHPLEQPLEVPDAAVREVVRGAVVTFVLRDDVLWHPSPGFEGHRLDARDVLFSWQIYANPLIACDERRYQFEKVPAAELVGTDAIRFFLARQDAWAADDLAGLCVLPAHLYDLADPDNPDHDPDASQAERARYVNENPRNTLWVGTGPYRVVSFEGDVIEAVRFEGYFDPARAGYVDRIRWRTFADETAALQALAAGELDLHDRLKAEDFFGELCTSAQFQQRLYRAWTTLGAFQYVCWNSLHPPLDDVRVRRALSHCLDVDDLLATYYRGLGNRVTGPSPFHSPGYDHDVPAPAFDLELATRLLAEAGWYDRDGDGWIDRDGEQLGIEYASIAGNELTRHVGLLLQENLRRIGVQFVLRDFEWSTFREGVQERRYDAFCQAWVPPLEPDPEQLWHSRWGQPGVLSANYAALRDEAVDELIERGQQELDDERRWELWRQLHARLAELAPYLWLVNPATKMAVSRRFFGVQMFHVEPGFDVRRWYLPEGTPGTRPAGGVGHWAQGR